MTFSVTVLETAFPFFGVTVTVTLHDPAFTPFRDVPLTLQYRAEDDATFSKILEPDATVSDAYFAMDDPVAAFFADTTGAAATVAPCPAGLAAAAGEVTGAAVVPGASVAGGAVLCGATDPCTGAAVVGAAVVGAAVVGGAVVGAAVVGAAVVVAAAALVTATEYVVDPAPDTGFTTNEMFSVAPAETLSVSMSEERAMVPVEFVRLMAEPDSPARTVKSTVADALGRLRVYVVTDGSKEGDRVPLLTVIESSVDPDVTASAASPSAEATPPMSEFDEPIRTLESFEL